MINFANSEEPEKKPNLIFSPADVRRVTKSDLDNTNFANDSFAEIAKLLEKLAILERAAEVKLRAWKHHPESFADLSKEIGDGLDQIRKRLHDIFLKEHEYPNGPQMQLMPSDVYAHGNSFSFLKFRDQEMRDIAHQISMIAAFEQELETYLTGQSHLDENERQAMIKSALAALERCKKQLTKILIEGYKYKK